MPRARILAMPMRVALYGSPAAQELACACRKSDNASRLGNAPLLPCGKELFPFFFKEESGERSRFFRGKLHPRERGYSWYRGYFLTPEKNAWPEIVVYLPWIWPQEYRDPLVLAVGDPPPEWADEVLLGCAARIRNEIERAMPLPRKFTVADVPCPR